MEFNNKDNLAEVILNANLTKNDINEIYEIIEQVARDDFDVCVCEHANENTLQFIGVGDEFSIEYLNLAQGDSIYKIQDKSKLDQNEEVNIYSEWGGATIPANSIVDYNQVKSLFNIFFKTDKFEEFKNDIDKLGFTLLSFPS